VTLCPLSETLELFLADRLSGPEAEAVERHVRTCPRCETELDQCSDNARLRAWGAEMGDSPARLEEKAAARLLRELPGATAPGVDTPPAASGPLPPLGPPQRPGDLGTLGPYRVLGELGRGGMGIVFRAHDTLLGRPVALKVLPPSHAADPIARQRFLRETQAAAILRHDHIVVIYQAGEHDNTSFLAMELLEGETLADHLRRQGALPLGEALRLARETADGLAAAHRVGLVHRDIKPANLWIEDSPERPSSGRLKILDFGLARPAAPASALTQTGVMVGTPGYTSPEQVGGEAADDRSDLFSLGCVLYHMTTGVAPFAGANLRAILRAILFETPRPPGELRPDVPPALAELLGRLLAKDLRDRPQSADEVREALRAIEEAPADLPASARTAGTRTTQAQRGPLHRGERRRSILAAGLGLLILGVAGVVFYPARAQLFHPGNAAGSDSSQEPAVPKPGLPTGPFVLRARAGHPERTFATLATAVAEAASGDTIEIRGDGPFLCDPIDLGPKDLILRAATGYRPRFQYGQPQALARGFLLLNSGKLVLEGLEFQCFCERSNDERCGLVTTSPSGSLHLAHCRFVAQSGWMPVRAFSAVLDVRRCEFLISESTWQALTWNPVPSQAVPKPRASVQGCLFFCPKGSVGFRLHHPSDLSRYSLDVRQNTFRIGSPLELFLMVRPQEKDAVAAGGKTGRVQLSANVFAGVYYIIYDYALREWNLLTGPESVDLYPLVFDWHDQRNAYARGVPLLSARDQPSLTTRPQRVIESLRDWQKLLGVTETSSVQGDIRFAGLSGKETDLDAIRPAQFRLAEGSIGKKAGPDGRDLGADVDAVGPGAAYEAWKGTDDYQKWLADTGSSK
jgi:serine/threonine protein kinase